jgi:hypothetical protein
MQKWQLVLPGTRMANEIARITNLCAEFLDPNFNVMEGDESWLKPDSEDWQIELENNIMEFLYEQGVDLELAYEVAKEAAQYYPWQNANFIVYEEG